MSTKTVAVEQSVYEKLLSQKKDSESFTKTINRLIDGASGQYTCEAAVQDAVAIWGKPLAVDELKQIEAVVAESRGATGWEVERPE